METAGEWLVTDGLGRFALGSCEGFRSRKYHGLWNGVAGREQSVMLADLEIFWNGQNLWPHRYSSSDGPVLHPLPQFAQARCEGGAPTWNWALGQQELKFSILGTRGQGIELQWSAPPVRQADVARDSLVVKPFFAFRDLHGVGGRKWQAHFDSRSRVLQVQAEGSSDIFSIQLEGNWKWRPGQEGWYRNFDFREEHERGYEAREDLWTCGELVLEWPSTQGLRTRWLLPAREPQKQTGDSIPILDFVLEKPAGLVAGYPWFGEWGRDTFIALPGVVLAWAEQGGASAKKAQAWAKEVFERWGRWIERAGMLPNILSAEPTWESSDATLWFTHALAALWAHSRTDPSWKNLVSAMLPKLDLAIAAIEAGRHRYLKLRSDGLLEVSGDRTTWMDAYVNGRSITPRNGLLPEINALWFQARALQALQAHKKPPRSQLQTLAERVLEIREEAPRPNRIFLHSLPLAPSAWVGGPELVRSELESFERQDLLTPVGPRTLAPSHPQYEAHYRGSQEKRDQAYHQGAIWPWISAHFAMAARRVGGTWLKRAEAMRAEIERRAVIGGHLPEILEAEAPHQPVGAPAQAWSLACWEEFRLTQPWERPSS